MTGHVHDYIFAPSMLGPYGRQDVHLHLCKNGACSSVMVGDGKQCKGRDDPHVEKTLTIATHSWSHRENEGRALVDDMLGWQQ